MVTYKDAGVDIDAANTAIQKLRQICPDIGGFGGLYPLGDQYLVSSTDGVGTKLKVAHELDKHHTIGIDLVAMCVNDILVYGAKPLFFLDYYATGKLNPQRFERVLGGIVQGCHEAGCALLGGETAEMPGFYSEKQYDLAGFCVGVVDKKSLIDGSTIKPGDVIVGFPSSGIHSNGFSLIHKIMKDNNLSYHEYGTELLKPTTIYVNEVLDISRIFSIKGMAHITGGGIIENLPRIFPKGFGANLQMWEVPEIFRWIQKQGNISEHEMMRTYNMGIGYTVILDQREALELCKKKPHLQIIGQITKHEGIQFQ